MKTALIPISALLIAGCSSADEMADDLAQDGSATATATGVASTGAEVQLKRESDGYTFAYSWPKAAGQEKGLAARLQADADAQEQALAQTTTEEMALAREDGFTFRKHDFEKDWEVVADLPDLLSLKARIVTYSGGAHPNTGYDSLVWNKPNAIAVAPLDFFRSPGNLERAVRLRFCELLDGERARRRGQLVPKDSEDSFDQCPDIGELTVLLRSSGGDRFDRVGLIAAPYVAGPYAEGPYEFTLPVDTSVLDAVRPEYVRYFALAR